MKYAIVNLRYDLSFLVPVKDLSKFLETIGAATPVSIGWLNDEKVVYRRSINPTIEMTDGQNLMVEEEFEERAEAERARRRQEREAEAAKAAESAE